MGSGRRSDGPRDPRGGVAINSVGLLCLEKERGPASLSPVRSAEQSRQLSAEFHSQPLRPGVLQNRLHLPPVSWGGTSRACTDTSAPQSGACTDTTGPAAGDTFGYHRAGTRHGHSRKVLGSPVPGKGYSSTSHRGGHRWKGRWSGNQPIAGERGKSWNSLLTPF